MIVCEIPYEKLSSAFVSFFFGRACTLFGVGINAFIVYAEYARGGELFDLLLDMGPPDEVNTAQLMKALVGAVTFVHMHGIIHGDIKVRRHAFDEAFFHAPVEATVARCTLSSGSEQYYRSSYEKYV